MLVRFTAVALIAWALVEIALYLAICSHNSLPVKPVPTAVKSLPMIAGLVLLAKAKAAAHWVSDKLDL